ncbi:MAG: hypothetical protein ED556_08675 [Winogradskyella sp.]|uniref:hypothetical protein n=1 Tax=Winogradskyella sp. TaxID=1883156 RepID=UPI000F3F1361|nr:hypothetical protein [Winogradskyella sp.]RNC86357.1 MAG: hypothetical protein ED556_08675 [Winogradskyella sp.]
MKKLIVLLLLSSISLNAQKPDYSQLTKKEKLYFLNGYGYIKLKDGDTIFGVAKRVKGKRKLNNLNFKKVEFFPRSLKVVYPRKLEKYSYLDEIPISEIEMFYKVAVPGEYYYVRELKKNTLILNKVTDGDVVTYSRDIYKSSQLFDAIAGGNPINTPFNGFSKSTSEIYFEGENGKLIEIIGTDEYGFTDKKDIRKHFIDFFKDEYELEVLEKVKPRYKKIIEFVEKHNKLKSKK